MTGGALKVRIIMGQDLDLGCKRKRFDPALIQEWIGDASFHWYDEPLSICSRDWLTIVTSHLSRHPEWDARWRESLKQCLQFALLNEYMLLASVETPMGDYLIHSALRMGVTVIGVRMSNSKIEFVLHSIERPDLDGLPLLTIARHGAQGVEQSFAPIQDRILISFADRVDAIAIRSKGKIERSLLRRLADTRFPSASVFVMIDLDVKAMRGSSIAASRLLDAGAIGWIKFRQETDEPQATQCYSDSLPAKFYMPYFESDIVAARKTDSSSFLTHCTRGRQGAWPDQSLSSYYDEVSNYRDGSGVDGSPLATLKRILTQNRLLATHHLQKSKVPTISLSNVPLLELVQRRKFQSHLGRWDWEPYGICIDREWLLNHGAKPVAYGGPKELASLPMQDLPYYHPMGNGSIDWRDEQEWRLAGDLHLANIPFEKAFIFVPTLSEAREIATVSRFPVMILSSCSDPKLH